MSSYILSFLSSKRPTLKIARFVSLSCIFLLAVAACNTFLGGGEIRTTSSIDTYIISKQGSDSLKLYKEIIKQASDFCLEKKQHFMPADKKYDETRYELTFRCLSSGDPEYRETDSDLPDKSFHKKLGGFGELKY